MSAEADNHRRWDGLSPQRFEVWYLTLNHTASGTGYWICYTLDAPASGQPFCQLWFASFDGRDPAGNVAIRQAHPIGALRCEEQPFAVHIDGSALHQDGARGQVEGDGHRARWELSWRPAAHAHRLLPPIMYRGGGLGESTVTGPNLDVAMSGSIEVDGRRVDLAGEAGNQSHLWGRAHPHRWAWAHCNGFDGRPGATLELLTARLRRGIELPGMTVACLYLDGRAYRWNRFASMPLCDAHVGPTSYRVSAWRPDVRIDALFRCRPGQMVATPYVDPGGGAPCWCHHTEIADVVVDVWRRGRLGRWRLDEQLMSAGRGHFEVGRPTRDPSIAWEYVDVH